MYLDFQRISTLENLTYIHSSRITLTVFIAPYFTLPNYALFTSYMLRQLHWLFANATDSCFVYPFGMTLKNWWSYRPLKFKEFSNPTLCCLCYVYLFAVFLFASQSFRCCWFLIVLFLVNQKCYLTLYVSIALFFVLRGFTNDATLLWVWLLPLRVVALRFDRSALKDPVKMQALQLTKHHWNVNFLKSIWCNQFDRLLFFSFQETDIFLQEVCVTYTGATQFVIYNEGFQGQSR